jgi:integrase
MPEYSFQGSLFCSGGRYYWKVKLPGEKTRKTLSLSTGGYSVRDKSVAKEVAQRIWDRHVAESCDRSGLDIKTVGELVQAYRAYVKAKYPPSSDMPDRIGYALDLITFRDLPAGDFGPMRLREARSKMLHKGLSAKLVNERTGFIRKMFEWAAGREVVTPSVPYALKLVEPLSGRDSGVEPSVERVPVKIEIVRATLPELTPTLQAMVKVQLYTGMRPSELVSMKRCCIDTSIEDLWFYTPYRNKNSWRGVQYGRRIALCKMAQEILLPFLAGCGQNDYIFKPSASMKEAGRNGKAGACYTKDSYRRAITRACQRAFPKGDIAWTPYQLRHTAATYIRKVLGDKGVSASQVYLGQRSIDVAEIYARADMELIFDAVRVMNDLEI